MTPMPRVLCDWLDSLTGEDAAKLLEWLENDPQRKPAWNSTVADQMRERLLLRAEEVPF